MIVRNAAANRGRKRCGNIKSLKTWTSVTFPRWQIGFFIFLFFFFLNPTWLEFENNFHPSFLFFLPFFPIRIFLSIIFPSKSSSTNWWLPLWDKCHSLMDVPNFFVLHVQPFAVACSSCSCGIFSPMRRVIISFSQLSSAYKINISSV